MYIGNIYIVWIISSRVPRYPIKCWNLKVSPLIDCPTTLHTLPARKQVSKKHGYYWAAAFPCKAIIIIITSKQGGFEAKAQLSTFKKKKKKNMEICIICLMMPFT